MIGVLGGMFEVKKGDIHLEIEGKDTRLLESFKAFELLPSELQFSGRDRIVVDAILKEGRMLSLDSRISLREFHIQDKIGRFAGENLSFELVTKGDLDLDKGSIAGFVSAEVNNGEILYDLFYLNFDHTHFSIAAKASYKNVIQKISFSKIDLELKDVISLKRMRLFGF